jgi:capsular polysaccharide biosynthesis protein
MPPYKKNFLKALLFRLIHYSPVWLIRPFLLLIGLKKAPNKNQWSHIDRLEYFVWTSIRSWSISKIVKLDNLIKGFELISIENSPSAQELYRAAGEVGLNYLPAVVGMTNGSEISYTFNDEVLYQINGVSFSMESDFVRGENFVICPKLLRSDASILVPEDFDFVKQLGKHIFLLKKKKDLKLGRVFHLSGVLSNFWSHFLIGFYPRLEYIQFLGEQELNIVIPYGIDPNIRTLIDEQIIDRTNVRIIEVDHDTEVYCEELFYADINSYILCHSNHVSPYGVQISKRTAAFLKRNLNYSTENSKFRRLFIGRTGGRNVTNYTEVLEYFKKMGFDEIFPHKLSISEKSQIFSEALYIVGPYSSGFTNVMYCQEGVKVLAFANYSRSFDAYIATLCKFLNLKFIMYTGTDTDSAINSDYKINVSKLDAFVKDYLVN